MKHWLLLTKVDIFLPNRKDIDSCSYDLESTELSEFSIKISKDKNQGRGYSELTIQAGCFQILATGGIYGNQDTLLGGFLGSSIPSNSIHEYNTKLGASYFAEFRSAIFAGHGFQGAHPLRYYQGGKPGVVNLSVIASKIICNYINKRVGENDIAEYLRLFLKTKVVKEISNERLKTVATVADTECLVKYNAVQLGNYASTILYKMKIMKEAVGDTLNPIDITVFDLESTNDKNTILRDLVNGTKIYNTALAAGSFPSSWQDLRVRLLPKKGDLSTLKNWRPISLINCDCVIS
ncbi:hypothetical protein G6F23_008599 [Rhizopus arrhizus]|nr:hypothetical protein G6F23_008599 [Rhizopus arrhizus]